MRPINLRSESPKILFIVNGKFESQTVVSFMYLCSYYFVIIYNLIVTGHCCGPAASQSFACAGVPHPHQWHLGCKCTCCEDGHEASFCHVSVTVHMGFISPSSFVYVSRRPQLRVYHWRFSCLILCWCWYIADLDGRLACKMLLPDACHSDGHLFPRHVPV